MFRSLCPGSEAAPSRAARARFTLCAVSLLLLLLPCMAALRAAPLGLNAAQRAWVAQHPQVIYAPERDYGPFVYVDGAGQVRGLSIDFLSLLSEKTGLRFVASEALPLSQNLDKAKSGAVDMLTSLRPTPERAAFLGFTSSYVSIPAVLVVRAGQPGARALKDMARRPVALGKGYAVEGFMRQRYPQVEWVALSSDAAALAELLAGRVDGVVADVASLQFLMRRHGWPALEVAGQVGFDYPLSFAYRKDLPLLGEVLQQGLQSISAGERGIVLARWLPPGLDGTWQNRPTAPMLPVGLLLALGAGLGWWGARRRRAAAAAAAGQGAPP